MNGWKEFRKEGLQEFERLIEVAKNDAAKAVWPLIHYYKVYKEGREGQISEYSGINPKFDPKNKKIYQNFVNSIFTLKTCLKIWLPAHYETEEGKKARYRLSIVERKGHPPLFAVKDFSKVLKAQKGKTLKRKNLEIWEDQAVAFLKIFPEVWKSIPCRHFKVFKQDDIINRVENGRPRYSLIAALLAVLVARTVMGLFFLNYVSGLDILPASIPIIRWLTQVEPAINWLKGIGYNMMCPLSGIVEIIWLFISSGILYGIYKFFGAKSNFLKTLTFNLYFVAAWLPFIFIGARYISMHPYINDAVSDFATLVLFYGVVSYISTLHKLMKISHKKGIVAFLLSFFLNYVFIKPFF